MKKTNEEISQELVSKFEDMLSHMEACLGFSERERLKDEIVKALEEKDREHREEMEFLEKEHYKDGFDDAKAECAACPTCKEF